MDEAKRRPVDGGWWPTWLPRGGSLPSAGWEARHRAVLGLLALHVLLIPAYGVHRDNSLGHAVFEASPVLLALLLGAYPALGRGARSAAAALGLMTSSGVLVHLSEGLIESHFHFFVMIPVVALYEAWVPFVVGVGYVLVHHGIMGMLDPRSVYNHPTAWEHPWIFAGVHAAFFATASIACIVNWWLHERARVAEAALVATLAHRAEHDGLTGLPNRAAFLNQDVAAPGPARPQGRDDTSVLMLDLDGFKEVNDTLGHSFGDHLLAQVGQRLLAVMREDDMLARLGGDEFAVLLRRTGEQEARETADRLRRALHDEFVVDGMLLNVDASIGVVTHVAGATRPDVPSAELLGTLLRQADVAMYAAKAARRGVAVYDPDADDHTRERLTLLADLRRALEGDELVLHYQPKVALVDQRLQGFEALVRWQHPQRGLLPPGLFIPAAEHTALIVPLTMWVIRAALTEVRRWTAQGTAVPVAVNVSPRCLLEPEFPREVLASLAAAGVPAHYLRLEITESTLMVDPDRARAALHAMTDGGVGVSIDDFGTGYSSMSYLRDLPVDELKIDRSFVSGMLTNHADAVLVQSAIELGHNLGLSVVAEGVETTDVLSALVDNGCDIAQGYLLSRPVPADQIEVWLAPAPAVS